jgi:hypothetical protein
MMRDVDPKEKVRVKYLWAIARRGEVTGAAFGIATGVKFETDIFGTATPDRDEAVKHPITQDLIVAEAEEIEAADLAGPDNRMATKQFAAIYGLIVDEDSWETFDGGFVERVKVVLSA